MTVPPPPPEDDWGSAETPWQQPPAPPPPPPPPPQWQQPQQPQQGQQGQPGQWQQPGGYPQGYGSPPPQIQTYLVPAILVTVLCCLPGGIAAIIYASQASNKLKAGDVAGATKAANTAKMWVIISVVVGVIGGFVLIAASMNGQSY